MVVKFKATDIANLGDLYFAGYCELENITGLLDKVGYYATAEGWRCDIYKLVDEKTEKEIFLLTGYGYPHSLKNKIKRFNYDLMQNLNKSYEYKLDAFSSHFSLENKKKAIEDIFQLTKTC